MKLRKKLFAALLLLGLSGSAQAQFDTSAPWGDADPTGSNGGQGGAPDTGTDPINGLPSGAFSSDGTTTTITSGGFDFWSANDGGTFVYDSGGAHTTTGDFTASVRHVEVNNNYASAWGRSILDVRAVTADLPPDGTGGANAAGIPTYEDAHTMACRRSNGLFHTGWRDTANGGTGRNDGAFPPIQTGNVGPSGKGNGFFMSIGRSGNDITTGYALDINGSPGRWIQHSSRAPAALAGGNEVIVGLGHQAHNQGPNHPSSTVGSGGGGRINTATFDNWVYTASFDPARFGLPAGEGADPWNLAGSISCESEGAVSGSAYVTQGGAATGEPVKWTLTARQLLSVDAGLTADIYLGGNPGNQAGARGRFTSPPAGSTVIPNIDWTGNNGTSATNAAPYNQGQPGDLVAAVPGFSTTNQDSYGVRMQGQIWIPGDADRLPGDDANIDTVAFKDGIDDYTFLGIDGNTLVDDNSWTSYAGRHQNGGSPIATLDVSDPKYDDGEWVSFEMIMWEGGGGDAGVLYWDQNAAGGFPAVQTDPATTDAIVPAANFQHNIYGPTRMKMGFEQVGSDTAEAPLPMELSPGDWDLQLTVQGTGTSVTVSESCTVAPTVQEIVVYCGDKGPPAEYSQDFCYVSGSADLGDGSVIGSSDGVNQLIDGSLRMTDSLVAGTRASLRLPALPNSSSGWTATIDFSLLHEPGHPNPDPADGLSFNYGAIPARTSGGAGPDQDGGAEEGWGGGIDHISFEADTWRNGDAEQGFNIAVNGADIAGGFQAGTILPSDGSESGTMEISWNPDETSFSTSGLSNLNAALASLPHGFTGDDNYGFGISARTGGATETLQIHSINIETTGDPEVSGGQLIDFGSTDPGVPLYKDFTIYNAGETTLTFTALPVLPTYWTITGAPPASVAPGERVTVELCFDGGGPGGIVGGTVEVASDDPSTPTFSFDVQAEVIDIIPPVIDGIKDLVFNIAEESAPIVVDYDLTVSDNLDPDPELVCDPPSGSLFDLGCTTVTCTATDAAGNVTVESFLVSVLPLIAPETLLEDPPAAVVLGGWDAPAGPARASPGGTTLRAVRSAHLNENGNVAVRASLDGGGASTEAVFSDSLASGALELLGAVGLNDVTSLDRVELNDAGDVNFRGDSATEFRLHTELAAGGGTDNAGAKAELLNVYKQAQAGDNAVAPIGIRRLGPITTLNDTAIALTDMSLIQEGTPSPAGGTYGQIAPRVVTNPSGTTMAFTAQIRGVPGATALGVFVGNSDGTGLAAAVRKGDPVPGAGVLSSVASESINEGGDLALRGTVQGPGIGGANNDVLVSNRNGGLELIAREGDDAPCIEGGKAGTPTLKRFDKIFIAGDGAVTFSAFLAGAGVNHTNDGGIWRSDADGSLTLIAREGDIANNTEDVIQQILGCAASTDGKSVFDGRLVVGIGETVTKNRTGLWAMRKVGGPAELLLRQGDTVEAEKGAPKEEEPDPLVLLSIALDESTNPQGGSGGYGRVISEAGQVVTRLSFSGGVASSGAFLLDLEEEVPE